MHCLGVHTHLFRGTAEAVAEAVRRHNLPCVQLTPGFPGLRFDEPGQITAERCRLAATPFQERGIAIAALAGGSNLLHPDLDRRHPNLMRCHALVRHCQDFGTALLVLDVGDRPARGTEPARPRSSEVWKELRLILAEILRNARECGVVVLVKPDPGGMVSTAEDALRLREALLPQGELRFVMDPAGLLSPSPAETWVEGLARLADVLGPWSPLVHAKDLRCNAAGISTPRVGRGELDYRAFFHRYEPLQPDAAVILEHLRPEEVKEAREYLDQILLTGRKAKAE
jgi:sugar phosphate isomerase/epimerase